MTEEFSQPFRHSPPLVLRDSLASANRNPLRPTVTAGLIKPVLLLLPVSSIEPRLRGTGGTVRVTLEGLMNQP